MWEDLVEVVNWLLVGCSVFVLLLVGAFVLDVRYGTGTPVIVCASAECDGWSHLDGLPLDGCGHHYDCPPHLMPTNAIRPPNETGPISDQGVNDD